MSPELANLIESLSPEDQQAIELWIREITQQSRNSSQTEARTGHSRFLRVIANHWAGGLSPLAASRPRRPFPFGEGADDPVVRGTPAQQEELWRAMTDSEVDDFYEGRY